MSITADRHTLLRGGAVALTATGTLFLGGCGGDTTGPEADARAYVDLAEIANFVGQQVTVSAQVSADLGSNAFTIADQSGETVLVVYDGMPQNLSEGNTVRVRGMVAQTFAVEEAEQFTGAEFDGGVYEDFNTDPYIRASNIDSTVTTGTGA